MTIAGHSFVEGISGRVCSDCGKTWAHVVARREFWRPGQADIAHTGLLNAEEVGQLHAEIDRIWQLVVATSEARGA